MAWEPGSVIGYWNSCLGFEKGLEHGTAWMLLENWIRVGEANGLQRMHSLLE
jgi:hypothetical protein